MIKIAIIGAGNVASHLGIALQHAGAEITAVYARDERKAKALATKFHTLWVDDIDKLPANTQLTIIAVKDEAIAEVSNQINISGTVAHTSGILGMDALAKHKHRGVFYPLQTLKAGVDVNFNTVPLLLEASNEETIRLLKKTAKLISQKVSEVKLHERQMAHLAAVFSNNFTNHLYAVANDILQTHGLSFDLLKPLIVQTAQNIQHQLPAEVQTGPAVRGDMETIDMHLQLLREHVQYRQLYELISASIIEQHRNKK
ncbi:MAG: Rossmann-like and DUF2520 domain-containing protein [Bacteroidota bacterium]